MIENPYQAPQANLLKNSAPNSKTLGVYLRTWFMVTEIAGYLLTAFYFYAGGDLQKSASIVFINWALISIGFAYGIRSNAIRFALLQVVMFIFGLLQLFIMLCYASINC
jgi:hypothetical protein